MASIWRLNDQNFWVTSLNDESDQITMDCIDLTSKQSKCWDTSQNIQNNANQRKSSNYNAWHRFDYNLMTFVGLRCFECFATYLNILDCFDVKSMQFKTIQNVEIRRKTFKTTQTNESDQIIMHGIDLTSKRSKLLSFVAKRRKWSNYSALHRFDV